MTRAAIRRRSSTDEGGGRSPAPRPIALRDPALAALIGLGVLLRLIQWLARRSYYIDESALLLSVFRRPLRTLLTEPLLFEQTAPPGFLALERFAFLTFGPGELSTRFFPLLAGIVALPLFAILARRLLPPLEAVAVTAILAVSPVHVYFTVDAKPYSFDVLAATFLLLWCHHLLIKQPSWRSTALGLLGGAVALSLSQPAALMGAACAAILGWSALRAGDWDLRRLLSGAGLAAIVLAAVVSAQSRMTDGGAAYMRLFWSSGFWPLPPRTWSDFLWLPVALSRFSFDVMGSLLPGLFLPPMIVGLIWLGGRDRAALALAAAPFGLVLVAAALELYPFGANALGLTGKNGRVVLFLLPSALLLLGAGLAWVREKLLARRVGPTVLLSSVLAGATLLRLLVFFPERRQEIRPILETVEERRQPADLLYLYYGGQYSFEIYAPLMGLQDAQVLRGRCARPTPSSYAADLAGIPEGSRVWVVVGHPFRREVTLILEYLERRGARLETVLAVDAAAILFDLSKPPSDRGEIEPHLFQPPPAPWPEIGCLGVFAGLEHGWRPPGVSWQMPR